MRNANQITVSNLLTHTSGIYIPNTEQPRNKSYSEADAINWIVKHVTKNTEKKVGKWNYNNVSFVLLAGIIRKTTGSSYSANIESRIARPLNLSHTFTSNNFSRNRQALFHIHYCGIDLIISMHRVLPGTNCPRFQEQEIYIQRQVIFTKFWQE